MDGRVCVCVQGGFYVGRGGAHAVCVHRVCVMMHMCACGLCMACACLCCVCCSGSGTGCMHPTCVCASFGPVCRGSVRAVHRLLLGALPWLKPQQHLCNVMKIEK